MTRIPKQAPVWETIRKMGHGGGSVLLCMGIYIRITSIWVLIIYAYIIDDSATSETTCNYTGLEDLEEGPRLLNLKGMQGSEGISYMKYNQKMQSEKAQYVRWPFLKRIIWSQKGGLRVLKKIWQVASPLNVLSTCCNCNVGMVFNFCKTFPFQLGHVSVLVNAAYLNIPKLALN